MTTALIIIIGISLSLSIYAFMLVTKSRQQVQTALKNSSELANAFGTKPSATPLSTGESKQLLTVEILNPMELAAEKSWIAGAIASISPAFIRKKVYEQTRGILEKKLIEFGVQADVRVVRND